MELKDNTQPIESKTELLQAFKNCQQVLAKEIIGQTHLVNRLVIALLADGHLLIEGAPGLAKTRAIKTLAACIEGDFHRIQFTPDLLPADLTGTDIYQPQDGSFHFQQGPLFHNIILADEVNRAPAKVQSALLEAMAERQITIGRTTHQLPPLFLVMATQNPIEQEGTYPLPEAQLDRFLLHIRVDYPQPESEIKILQLARKEFCDTLSPNTLPSSIINQSQIQAARREILQLHLSEKLQQYIVQLVVTSRQPDDYSADLKRWIEYGASPRGSIGLEIASRAHAWLMGRDYVSPDDVQAVAHDVLRHRILLTFEAEADGINTDQCIDQLLRLVAVP